MDQLENIKTMMESEEIKSILSENDDLIAETSEAVYNFGKTLKAFVLANEQEFLGENLEETFKNIRVFSEVATAQYITEITESAKSDIEVPAENLEESKEESSIEEYL